jgi:hypothetical protein
MPPADGVPGADAVVPPPEAVPPPEDLPAAGDELPSPPTAIPPVGDETTPPAEFVPPAEFDSDEAAFPDGPCMARAEVCGNVDPVSRAGMSDPLVSSCSEAPASKSIFKGDTDRCRGAKLNCHKQIICAVIETRRNHEKRAVSMLPNTFFTTWSP